MKNLFKSVKTAIVNFKATREEMIRAELKKLGLKTDKWDADSTPLLIPFIMDGVTYIGPMCCSHIVAVSFWLTSGRARKTAKHEARHAWQADDDIYRYAFVMKNEYWKLYKTVFCILEEDARDYADGDASGYWLEAFSDEFLQEVAKLPRKKLIAASKILRRAKKGGIPATEMEALAKEILF